MTPFEIYKTHLALDRHFKTAKYDYFRYGGGIKASSAAWDKLKYQQQAFYKRVAIMKDPYDFLVGNYIFGNPKWVNDFEDRHRIQMHKYQLNGFRFFCEDIERMREKFNDNFAVDDDNSMPYVLRLVRSSEISIYTACVFNHILNCHQKWSLRPQFMVFETISRKVDKSTGFFTFEKDKYKDAIKSRFI